MENEKVTVEDVAYKTGMPETCINWILESGFLSLEALERMAAVAGVPADEIIGADINGNTENVIEYEKNGRLATATLTRVGHISRVKKLASKYPDVYQIVAENKDGSVLVRYPVKYMKFGSPYELTEEQKEVARQNLDKARLTQQLNG